MKLNDDGTISFGRNLDSDYLDSGRLVRVGTIQLMRGNQFTISLDEHRLPEGTRDLYIKEEM